jgi:hypothetical protein
MAFLLLYDIVGRSEILIILTVLTVKIANNVAQFFWFGTF